MEDPRNAVRSANKVDSTAFLREKLGFMDDSEWKRFSNRRLELINTLRLDEHKASKQEPQIRQVAEKVAKEFRYGNESIPDFERLVRLGIQSVRRNRRRPTKTGSLATTTFDVDIQQPPHVLTAQFVVENPARAFAELSRPIVAPDNPLVSAGALRLALGLASEPHQLGTAQTLLSALEVGALGEELARLAGAQTLSQAVTSGCLKDQALCVHILRALLAEFLAMPDLASMLQHVKNAEYAIWRLHAQHQQPHAQHSQHPQQRPQPQSQHTPPHAQQRHLQQHVPQLSPSAVTPVMVVPHVSPVQPVQPIPLVPAVPPRSRNVPVNVASSAVPSTTLPPLKGPMWAERLVTISHKNLELKFTFSPLNGSPPQLVEIIETCRASFGLSNTDVLRVRIRDSGKLIESNADLADAFLSNKLNLEIFLPPKPEPQFQ